MATVKELKAELEKLGLSTEGLKADLEARLENATEDAAAEGPLADAVNAESTRMQQVRAYAKKQADAFNAKFRK